MKRKLLYFASIILFTASSISAQNVYDFGGATIAGYTNLTSVSVINALYGPGTGTNPTVPNAASTNNVLNTTFTVGKLTFTPGGSARLRTDNTALTRYDGTVGVSPAFTPTPSSIGRLASNAVGNATNKYNFKFALTAGDKLTIFVSSDATSGSTSASFTVAGPTAADSFVVTGNLTQSYVIHITAGTTGDYVLYDPVSKLNVYRIYESDVTNAVLGTQTFTEVNNVNIYANNGKIFLSDVKSTTKVNIYNVLGALVKSIEVNEDTGLDVNSGFYIVKAQSVEGVKSVKVLVN
ncbi:T9SS type A sorting domain-containing protein [Flavobacterium ajazii]|uniref:T9SS type A sorting domain-containing protein n=1 Tax=Flavobacterium ajazii TaxID=2692318 RepID=UPI0013D6EF98|nr:T9SS type A sorting domain-containing protein [Flavobacterium ajazii]